jgi:hypothetical protein
MPREKLKASSAAWHAKKRRLKRRQNEQDNMSLAKIVWQPASGADMYRGGGRKLGRRK